MTDSLTEPGRLPKEDTAPTSALTEEDLVDAAYRGFSTKNRERISREEVARVVAELALDDNRPRRISPSLRVMRLRFVGEKRLHDRTPQRFSYDQAFSPGVNVICIPDNEVGKSSILKTIKYGLTGDDGDFDADVRSWIEDIWLSFALDRQKFTVLLTRRGDDPRALLVLGEEFGPLESVADEATSVLIEATGADLIKDDLQQFFFRRLGLEALSWTQDDPTLSRGVAERSTSWLTYFQALEIPAGGGHYLLIDPQHAYGNQEGLILSAYLGLRLVEPLNRLGVEASRAKKEAKNEQRETAEQVQAAQEQIGHLEEDLKTIQRRLEEIDAAQRARRQAVEGGTPALRLIEIQSTLAERVSEQVHLSSEREEINQSLRRLRARSRQLREAAALHLHFTGLEVSLCPNCDASVDPDALEREKAHHMCRLCGKHAQSSATGEIPALEAEAEDLDRQSDDGARERDAITGRLRVLLIEIEDLAAEVTRLTEAAQQGITYALPTEQEDAERNELLMQAGRLRAELSLAKHRAAPKPVDEESDRDLQVRILEKVREILRQEAEHRNSDVLARLSGFTQETTARIGAESVSDVACSALGRLQLRKYGQSVSFSGIQNEGEQLRIKLAFFLAMMRLGREPGLGRHPGFLLIDQPGTNEMVPEDFRALAAIFRTIDDQLTDQVQIICATARPEFQAATGEDKVYGPQAPPYAF